jgi:glutaredoxin
MAYTIYTKTSCVFCKRAKDLLDILGEDYEEFNIEEGNTKEAMNTKLGYEARTVPQIWEGNAHIGGYTELVAHTK